MMKDQINMQFLATLRIHSLANRETVCPTTNPHEKKGNLNNLWYTTTPSLGNKAPIPLRKGALSDLCGPAPPGGLAQP